MIKVRAIEMYRPDQCYTTIRLNPSTIGQYQVIDKTSSDHLIAKMKEKNISLDENALLNGTSIYITSGAVIYIKESPEELDKLIEEYERKRQSVDA